MLTHYNLVAQAMQMRRDERGLSYDVDSQLGVLPFFHIYVSLRAQDELKHGTEPHMLNEYFAY